MSDTCPICGGPNPDIGSHWCWRCRNAARTGERIAAAVKAPSMDHEQESPARCWICGRSFRRYRSRRHYLCSPECREIYQTRLSKEERRQLSRCAIMDPEFYIDLSRLRDEPPRSTRKRHEPEERTCWLCGASFQTTPYTPTQKFCSPACALAYKRKVPAKVRAEHRRRCREAGGYVYIDLRRSSW